MTEKYKAALRERGYKPNPWRIGVEAGKAGDDGPNPYTHPRSMKLYAEGLRYGLQLRRGISQAKGNP